MNNNLLRLIDRFVDLDVLVIGEAMLDSYLEGSTDRLCREAPVPVVSVAEQKDAPGGAANTAANIYALGGRVHFLSVIGADAEGERLRRALTVRGVSTEHLLTHPSRRTLAKHRVVADGQILVRFDQGNTDDVDPAIEAALLERLDHLFHLCDALVVSDYGYGFFTSRVIQAIARLQSRSPRIVVADSKQLERYRDVGVTAVKPNYDEAVQLLGLPGRDGLTARAEQIAAQGERVLEVCGTQIAAITLDTAGAMIFEQGRSPYRTYARPRPHSRATGAGDTFVSALALALAAGAHTPAAAELASAAATIVVGQDGTATCTAGALQGYVSSEDKYVRDRSLLEACIAFHRQQGRQIVFTNGCFDILHRGHITYLSRAKALGDVLIVGVNSDESVRRLKGESRPINTLEDRVQVLAALSCVDYVVPFGEDTPSELIRAIRPDVFVKGGDYTLEMLPEAPLVTELGGEVRILPYLEDRSTTGIIERIREVYAVPNGLKGVGV
ncbi:MAG: D-glycero-beta-D-manno-heptose 1-phosphate adenylyltransferase [Chloroflexota bacterium]|nr:D-glycero-beta-D-manno-heptose 1-phosphate adenylyltransferase [Chloroflexota bacterium]